ncbi:MAG TPA: LacI family DNA-binding transcriptional regulator [Pseudonocardiaceae bacterium]|jgi:LacI family transcriptional regulator|nr:LacI family DNA-binding transcriptional regulator [Pseudonocardiaceae bacterium]
MVTMRDVAELAGVSITTVSHVINKTRPVATDTVGRVLAAVETTGYTGDAIARSLVTGGTRSIGLALPLTGDPQLTALLRAVDAELTAAGHTLILADTHDEADREGAAVRALRSRRVDGVLLTPTTGAPEAVLPELRKAGVPTVLVGRMPEHTGFDQVGPENVQATSDLVRHLGELGHRRIALITGPDGVSTAAERALGYRLGLGRAKLVWDAELVASGPSQDAAEALETLLALSAPPTAVVAGDNPALIGVLRAARRRGLRIGSDLALVAHEDVDWAELVDPAVTATAQPVEEIGRAAVRMLLERIANPDGPPRTVRLAPTLMHRQSCGCP